MLQHHFAALSSGSWAGQKGELPLPTPFPVRASVGTVDSHHRIPRNWPALPALPLVLPRGGPQGCTCVSLPNHCCVLHKGSRLPWAGGPRLLGYGLRSQESVWQLGQISPCPCDASSYRGQGLRGSCRPLLCRAISRTNPQRPDQEHPSWSPL